MSSIWSSSTIYNSLYIGVVFYANCHDKIPISFAPPQNLCYNNFHDGTKYLPKNAMFLLHTNTAPLGRVLWRVLRFGDCRSSLWRAGVLCKPRFCHPWFRHHLLGEASPCPGISIRAGFKHIRDSGCRRQPRHKDSFPLGKTDRNISFFRQYLCKSAYPLQAAFGA